MQVAGQVVTTGMRPQLPAPSQKLWVRTFDVQELAHSVDDDQSWQLPLPSHRPSSPQVD